MKNSSPFSLFKLRDGCLEKKLLYDQSLITQLKKIDFETC